MRVLVSDLARASQGLVEVLASTAPAEPSATPLQRSERQRLSVAQRMLWPLTAVTKFCEPPLPALGRFIVRWLVAHMTIVAGVSLCGLLILYANVDLPGWLWNLLAATLHNAFIDVGVYLPLVAFATVAWVVRRTRVQHAAALSSSAIQGSAWTGRSPIRQTALWQANHQQLYLTPIRLEMWRCAINLWLARPVFGGGPGERAICQARGRSFANCEQRQLHRLPCAHQHYRELPTAQGLCGLVLFALWMAGVVRGAWRGRQCWEGATVLAGLAILLVGSLFNSFLIDLSTRYLWMLLAAVAMAWAPVQRPDRDRAGA